jgi:putative membrane protein
MRAWNLLETTQDSSTARRRASAALPAGLKPARGAVYRVPVDPGLADLAALAGRLGGTVALRPYVFAFLLAFLATAGRDLGGARTAGLLVWGYAVALGAELASTRVGIPFGLYHYTESTRDVELFVANVPFFDSLSFPFLAYAAFCVARRALGEARPAATALFGAALMTWLDVVIDPLAVRGDRWFLGRIFWYPEGGAWFGVPLSNFAGWFAVGLAIIGGYVLADRRPRRGSPAGGVGLYAGILAFNLVLTAWIGEWLLLGAGLLVHAGAFLVLYGLSATGAASRPDRAAGAPASGRMRAPHPVAEEPDTP